MRPIESAWALTASASSASRTAHSAPVSPATARNGASVRPARKTRAPSRAKARATAPPIEPAPP